MKRKALLIGNSNGLPGVKMDICNFSTFLQNEFGGQWYESEIVVKMNPSRTELISTINSIKSERNDFSFVVFSGHGAYEKSTVLEINGRGECIYETELIDIAPRQISIFDCCRQRVSLHKEGGQLYNSANEVMGSVNNIRPRYEARIMQAIPQQVSLYACSIGESALDTENGGMYIKNLLKSAVKVSDEYKLVGVAHEEASSATSNEAWRDKRHNQTPTATLPKCISMQQLIISINPNYNYRRFY